MTYTILKSDFVNTLAEEVNEHIANGWKPQGGVSAYSHGMSTYYCQALILED